MAVLPGIAAFTRVCAYDRPGTMLDADHRSRSDPVPMPRTAADAVADLHALIDGAGIPGPYVLVGHSLGGIIVRLYAATYPNEIAGLVLVDASHEEQYVRYQAVLTAEQWADLQKQAQSGLDDDPERERMDFDASFAQLRAATHPLPPLPLVVLTHGVSTGAMVSPEVQSALPPDFPWDALEAVHQELQDELAALVPGARHVIATKSGHFIQVDQPQLVIDAIQQVVAAVHDPTAWTAPTAASPSAASGDFSGLVDIGGRNIYLECRGEGSPTVILKSGAYARGDFWTRDLEQPEGERTMVLPGVAEFTRVCAYDRPGTLTMRNPSLDPYGPLFYPSRSDPVPQPRTTQEMVDELHALLAAAAIPAPYVLVGHSAAGLVVRLYASEYPDEVVGMVLLDSTHEDGWLRFQEASPPEQWTVFEAQTVTNQDLLDAYPEAERMWTAPLADDATSGQVRQARKEAPLHPMPLVVLMHGIPFGDPFPGWPADTMEAIMLDLQKDLATLVPNAHFAIATESGHNIHQDQPELVIDAIQDVVEAVRDPSTWTAVATPAP